ncbi:MAG: hypothetical protein WCG23_07740 [bacterium]
MVSSVLQVLPFLRSDAYSEGMSAGSSMKAGRYVNNIPFYMKLYKQAKSEMATGFSMRDRNEVTKFNFLGGTFLEKFVDKHCSPETKTVIKNLDKNLIDSKVSQRAIEYLSDGKFQVENGQLFLEASEDAVKSQSFRYATGKLASNILGVTTRFGLLTSGLTEAPDLYSSYQNGDFGKQTVRSVSKIVASTVTFGTIAHFAKELVPPKYRTFAMFGGAIAGSIIASKSTDAVLDKVIGKSIKAQNREAAKYLTEMQKQRALTSGLS